MKKLNSLLNFLIFALIAVFVAVPAYMNRARIEQFLAGDSRGPALPSQKSDQMVNKYLKETLVNTINQETSLKKSLLEIQAQMALDEKKKFKQQEKENASIPAEKQIWKESDFKPAEPPPAVSSASSSSSGGKMTEEEKAEYKRQFIENARRDGYEIELSDDLDVIKSTPIEGFEKSQAVRKPSKENDSIDGRPSD